MLSLISSWWKTMMDSMLALIPKEHSSQSNINYNHYILVLSLSFIPANNISPLEFTKQRLKLFEQVHH